MKFYLLYYEMTYLDNEVCNNVKCARKTCLPPGYSILIYLHLIIWLYFMQLWIDCNKISDHMPLDYTYTEQCKTTFLSLKLQCLGFLLIPLISMFKYRYHSKRCFKKEKVHRQKQTRQWIRRWVVWSLVLWLCCIPSHRYTYT